MTIFIGFIIDFNNASWLNVNGSFMDGDLKWFPFGFYQYTVNTKADLVTTTDEAIRTGDNIRIFFFSKIEYIQTIFPSSSQMQ